MVSYCIRQNLMLDHLETPRSGGFGAWAPCSARNKDGSVSMNEVDARGTGARDRESLLPFRPPGANQDYAGISRCSDPGA